MLARKPAAVLVPALSWTYTALFHHTRYYASAPSNSVFTQLADIAELAERVGRERSKSRKTEIILEYPQLRDVLEVVYDPNHRTNITSRVIGKHSSGRESSYDEPGPKQRANGITSTDGTSGTAAWPQTITDLLDMLSSRRVTGNAAKDLCVAFINHYIHSIPSGSSTSGATVDAEKAEETFMRLIDRNLVAGFGAKTLLSIPWPDRAPCSSSSLHEPSTSTPTLSSTSYLGASPPSSTVSGQSSIASSNYSITSSTSTRRSGNLDAFSCALGKSIEPPFTDLSKKAQKWFVSRKLDGVRVLALLDFIVPESDAKSPLFHSATFVSRAGNRFTSLLRLEEQLRDLERYPPLRDILVRDPIDIERTPAGPVKRLVLDGEVCLMRRRAELNSTLIFLDTDDRIQQDLGQLQSAVRVKDNGTARPSAAALWEDNGYVEDFSGAVSAVKTNQTMENPAYFLFDLLNWTEVTHKSAQKGLLGLGKTFGERIPEIRALADWLTEELEKSGEEAKVRALVQWPMEVEEVEGMVQRAAEEGWEGLIFRADQPYKGARSVDIRKFKKWADAEYKVVDYELNTMRLPINGTYGDHQALASVWIEHKGHRVSVGSGFTPVERVRYAKDPSLIVGKQITVQYFSESDAAGRPGVKSLRFPRIKAVWGEKRDI